jgi:glycosyltransferase involved in cell wall biosynthesis
MKLKTIDYSISILQLATPNYAVPFYSELTKYYGNQLEIVTGPYFFNKTPKTVEEITRIHRKDTNNIFFFNHNLAFQYPLPISLFSRDICVLEFNPRNLTNLFVLAIRKMMGKKVILWGHGLSRRAESLTVMRKIRKLMATLANAVIFYSEEGKKDFIELGIPDHKLFVAWNAIDVTGIQKIRKRGTSKNIIFVGRLVPSKKVDILIEGFSKAYLKLPPKTKLLIVGDGEEKKKLVQLTKKLGMEGNILFLGEIDTDEKLAPVFADCVLGIHPGAAGLFIIHCFAFGIPILLADHEPHGPEIEACKRGINSDFFSANDSDSLSEMIIEMFKNEDKLALLGKHALSDVKEKYSIEHMVEIFKKVFDYV